jgi:hypothetical protein
VGLEDVELGATELGLSITTSAEKKSELLERIPQRSTTDVDSGQRFCGNALAVAWIIQISPRIVL